MADQVEVVAEAPEGSLKTKVDLSGGSGKRQRLTQRWQQTLWNFNEAMRL